MSDVCSVTCMTLQKEYNHSALSS